jgi:hypothetical protein
MRAEAELGKTACGHTDDAANICDMNREPRARVKGWAVWGLVNSLWLLPLAYGVKCLVTLSGRCLGPHRGAWRSRRSFGDLYSVQGEAAVWAGLGYFAIAVFIYLFVYAKPGLDGSLAWQVVRRVVCWGSLGAVVWLWYKALHV